jgi:serine/threonine-protein kinase PknK
VIHVGDQERLLPGTFVGRDSEVSAALRALSQTTRLLTLTGPPGVGKTRLATEVAQRIRGEYADGVVFVDLSSARDAVTALGELARQIGADLAPAAGPRRVVHDWLQDKQVLLLLDNAEQVAGLAAEIPGLLEQGHGIRILVTSRESLRLGAERTLSVPPLAMPTGMSGSSQPIDLEQLATTASVQMFAAEARSGHPDFVLTADNAAAIAEVCVRVDGLPLAIKLAAVRVKLLSPADIAVRLRDRRALLETTQRDIPARHRTLRSAISWSYELLEDHEQAAFRRLSVFNSPWTVEAAEAVLDQPGGLLEILDSLIDKSLIQRQASEPITRFTMLDSLREYAAEELDAHNERAPVARRHLQYFTAISIASEAVIGTASEARWWDPMTMLERDVRSALDWADDIDDVESAVNLATALGWYRYLRGHVGSGSGTVESALRKAATAENRPSTRSSTALCVIGGVLAWARGELERADELLSAAVSHAQPIGDRRHEAMATAFMGHVARDRGVLDIARIHHKRAGLLHDELGNPRGSAWARFDLGRTEWQAGNLERAGELLRDSLTKFRRIDYHWAAAWTAWALGRVRLAQGDIDNGLALTLDSMETFESVSDRRGVANCLESLAVSAGDQGWADECLRLLSAADQLRTRLLAPLTEPEARVLQPIEQSCGAALGEYEAESAREAGRAMTIPAVLDLARSVGAELKHGSSSARRGFDQVLTGREREVAELVASGRTNQQIGSSLGITARTAEAHVRNIMGKLDVHSRSEVAVWMVTHR